MKYKGCRNKEFRGLQITYPASGFQQDAIRLLQRFVATKSIRFDEFLTVWKASNFTLVFLGRVGTREKREFIEEAFTILLKYIMPPYNLQLRVGGVYMLYSMYYTQRLKYRRRIRIPLSCWPNFCQLRQEVIDQKHLDVAYIIRKLIADRAFILCAYPSMLSVDEVYLLENNEDRSSTGGYAFGDSGGLGEGSGLLAQILEEDNIGQLHAVHEKYHQLKCEFNLKRGGVPDRPSDSVNLIKPGITETILGIINASKPSPTRASTSRDRTDYNWSETSKRAQRLKSIKESALSSKVGLAVKPYRVLQKEYDNALSGDSEAEKNLTESGFLVRKKGRPPAKRPEVENVTEKSASSNEEADDCVLPLDRSKSRKTKRRWNFNGPDNDYSPAERIDLADTPPRKKLPKRRNRTRKSMEDQDEDKLLDDSTLPRKSRRTTAQGRKEKQGDVDESLT